MVLTSEKVREIVTVLENGWCQGAYARNQCGEYVSVGSDSAVRHCIQGALRHVYGAGSDPVWRKFAYIFFHVNDANPLLYNDQSDRTQEEVVAAVWRVASHLEEMEANGIVQ